MEESITMVIFKASLGINLKRDSKKIFSNVNQQRLKNNPVKILKSDIPIIFNKY